MFKTMMSSLNSKKHPSTEEIEKIPSYILGVNADKLDLKNYDILEMASCTTNCLAPIAKVLNGSFGITNGFMTTVHSYTNDQKILDLPHKDLRRARAAAINLIPTSTGAASAIGNVIPELKGKVDGLALRVPVACGSIVDFVAELNKNITVKKINDAFKKAANGKMKGVLQYTEDELVSSDIIGNPNTSIVDGLSTQLIDYNFVKVLAWYDNEYAYSCKVADLIDELK